MIATPYCANAMLPSNPVAFQDPIHQKSNILIRVLIGVSAKPDPQTVGFVSDRNREP